MNKKIKSNHYSIKYDRSCEAAGCFLDHRLNQITVGMENTATVKFVIKMDPGLTDSNAFQMRTVDSTIYLTGSNLSAVFSAVTHYLKEFCAWSVFWGDEHLPRLEKIPVPRDAYIKKGLPKHMLYLNPVTYGYSTVWWDEKRWLQEFDWMVCHNLNMPLALMGQEFIWDKVWKQFGVEDLGDYFAGPAFLPWQRMGNVNRIGGPLPEEWIQRERKMQHFFLEHARKLGMTPVLQGFAGFVPPKLKELYPNSKFTSTEWCNFPQVCKIDPSDPLFMQIGKVYMQELIREYGTDHYYLADAFNEMAPPKDMEPKIYAACAGEKIYTSMSQVDSEAVWVLQSWQFLGNRDYWQPDVVNEFLEPVPKDKVLIIEVGAESSAAEQWKFYKGYNGRPWIWSVFHNGGGTPAMWGNIDELTDNWYKAKKDPLASSMVGEGIVCEGLETNPIIYELCSDLFSERYPGNMDKWLDDYCLRRYGNRGFLVKPSLQELLREVYGSKYGRFAKSGWSYFSAYQAIPILEGLEDNLWQVPHMTAEVKDMDPVLCRSITPADMESYRNRDFTASLLKAVEFMLSAAGELKECPLYLLDLVDVTRQCVGDCFDRLFVQFIDARDAKDIDGLKKIREKMLKVLQLQVEVLSTNEHFHLGTWVRSAEKASETEENRKLYRFNAKDLVLRWGSTILYDYAKRDWAELVRDIYLPRMEMFIAETVQSVAEKRKFNNVGYLTEVNRLEDEWENSDTPLLDGTIGDTTEVCGHVLKVLKAWCEYVEIL